MKTTTPLEDTKSEETTIISKGVIIEGKVTSNGNIRVEGIIQGDILSKHSVVVGENGKVNGKIDAASINIGGKVSGTISAKEKLILGSKGNIKGDIFTTLLVVEEGAVFNGKGNVGESVDALKSQETTKSDNTTKTDKSSKNL
jgi:cytoskeletal protein CcmA (bactofilin family)